ncbi:MAG TPA: DedA family protein [Caulobacteraceae bacterium]|nr:DedA family protein [Caulobacteraceae bacterium]
MHHLIPLVASYGYAATFVLLFLESLGIPVPGEGILIATALFAARTQRLELVAIIATAAAAAFLGTSAGYLLGRSAGHALIIRFGGYVGLSPARQRLGQYLFARHGAKIIFLGRFIAVLRAFEGVLAGANRMPWRRFLIFNALGAIVWVLAIALGAFYFGRAFVHLSRPLGLGLLVLGGLGLVAAFFYARSREADLQRIADAALAGPGQ